MPFSLSVGTATYALVMELGRLVGELRDDPLWHQTLRERLGKSGYAGRVARHTAGEAAALADAGAPFVTVTREEGGAPVVWLVAAGEEGQVGVLRLTTSGRRQYAWSPAQLQRALGDPAAALDWLVVQPVLLLEPLRGVVGPLRRLWALCKVERQDAGWVLLYAVASGLLGLTVPVAVQTLVNTVAFSALLQPLLVLTALVGVALTYGAVMRLLQLKVVEHVQRRLFVRVATDLMRRAPSWASHSPHAHRVAHKFFEVASVQKAVASLLVGGLDAVLQVGIGITILGFYHPWLLAIDVLLVGALAVVLVAGGRRAVGHALAESGAKYGFAEDLENIATAAPGGVAASVADAHDRMDDYLAERGRRYRVVFAQHVGCAVIGVVVSVMLLGAGGWLVLRQQLSLGQLVAAELIVSTVSIGASKLSRYLDTFYDLLTSVEKVGTVVDRPIDAAGLMDLPAPRWPLALPLGSAGNTAWARGTLWALPAMAALFLAVPWQQTARGDGRVVAYAPTEREQPIESPVEGRVVRWLVQEGHHVKAGDLLVNIADNDANLSERMEAEQASLEQQLQAALAATGNARANILAMTRARELSVSAANARAAAAVHRADSAARALTAAEAGLHAAQLNQVRQKALSARGLVATRQHELAEMALATAQGEREKMRAALSGAEADVEGLRAEAYRTDAAANAEIEKAGASLQAARSAEGKLEVEVLKLQTRRSRQAAMAVSAPRDGTVLRINSWSGSGVVKAGDLLATFVPDADVEAVELWVDGLDAPLMEPGRSVRLQFEGWPAVQFSGWPVVAVGTFAGEIAFVDASVQADGRQRIVVTPRAGSDWPAARYLRQGVRAHGWVRLNTVTLGYEMWRKLNDFPIAPTGAMYQRDVAGSQGKAGKGGKGGADKSEEAK